MSTVDFHSHSISSFAEVLIHVVTALQERVPSYMRSEIDPVPLLWEGAC